MKKTLGIIAASLAMGIGVIGINKAEVVETLASSDITINEKDKKIFDRFADVLNITESDYYSYINGYYHYVLDKSPGKVLGNPFFEKYNDISNFESYFNDDSDFKTSYISESKMSLYYNFILVDFLVNKYECPVERTQNELLDQLWCFLDHLVPIKYTAISFFNEATKEDIEIGSESAENLFSSALDIYLKLKETAIDTYGVSFLKIGQDFESYIETYFVSGNAMGSVEKQQNINNRLLSLATFIDEEELENIIFRYFYPTEPGFGRNTAEEILGFNNEDSEEWYDGENIITKYYDLATERAQESLKAYVHVFTMIDFMFTNSPKDFLFGNFFLNSGFALCYKVLDLSLAVIDRDLKNIPILAIEVVEETQYLYDLYLSEVESRYDADYDELTSTFETYKGEIEILKATEIYDASDLADLVQALESKKFALAAFASSVLLAYEEKGIEKFNVLYEEILAYCDSIDDFVVNATEEKIAYDYSQLEGFCFGVKVDCDLLENIIEDDENNYLIYKEELVHLGNTVEMCLEILEIDIAIFGEDDRLVFLSTEFNMYKDIVADLKEKLEVSHYYNDVKQRFDEIVNKFSAIQETAYNDQINYELYIAKLDNLYDQSIELGDDLESYIETVGEVHSLTNYRSQIEELTEFVYMYKIALTKDHNLAAAYSDVQTRCLDITNDINLLNNTYVLDAGNSNVYLQKVQQILDKIDQLELKTKDYLTQFPSDTFLTITQATTIPSYKSQLETISEDIDYRSVIFDLNSTLNRIYVMLEETSLVSLNYEDYTILEPEMDDFVAYLADFISEVDSFINNYGKTTELSKIRLNAVEALESARSILEYYREGYRLRNALEDLDFEYNLVSQVINDLYLIAFDDFDNFESYLELISELAVLANNFKESAEELITQFEDKDELIDMKEKFEQQIEEIEELELELSNDHNIKMIEKNVTLKFNSYLDIASEIAGNFNLNDSKSEENISKVSSIIESLGDLKTSIENYVEVYGETDTFTELLEEIPHITDDLIELKTDIEAFHLATTLMNDTQNRYNDLLTRFNAVNAVYKFDDAKYADYSAEASAIMEEINEVKLDILKYKDDTHIDNFLDDYNDLLSTLRINCDTMRTDIERRHYDNEVNAILAESSGLEARVEEISENYKTNGLNFNGDLEECAGIAEEIEALIEKIDSRSDINTDQRITDLRAKLVELQTQVSSTKESVQKDHTLMIALIVVCSVVFVLGILALLYFFGFKKRFLRKETR